MIIIKIGGGAAINYEGIVDDLAQLDDQAIIVHGANALRDSIIEDLGIEKQIVTSISGYSSVLTDDRMIDAIMMSYAGLQNARIVQACQQRGVNAIGLSGIDGALIRAKRNQGIKVEENGRKRLIRDRSGKPASVNTDLLRMLLDAGYMPVISIPTLDENGFAINSENDDIVRLLHHALTADRVFQFIEASGYLSDPADDASVVTSMTRSDVARALEQSSGRMKRKLYALDRLLENPTTVHIADGRIEHPLRDALAGAGTVIR